MMVESPVSILRRATLVLLLLIAVVSAHADEPEEAAESEPVDVDLAERVVVTATGRETSAENIASTVTLIPAEEIEHKQLRFGVDAIRGVPGVDVRRSGGPGTNASIFIRGADADHTVVLLDGIELNDPSAPSRIPFLDHLTTEMVERVEVLRGPQSTLYGSDAMGGVVHFITKRGADDPRTTLWTEGGSFSTLRGGITSSGGSQRTDYFLSASQTDADGFSATSTGTEDDPYRNTSVAGRFGFRAGPGRGLDLLVHYTDARTAFDGFGAEEDHFIDSEQTMAKIEPWFRLWDGRWLQRFGLRVAEHERDTRGDFPSFIEGRLFEIDWRNDLNVNEGHTFTLGLEGEWEEGRFPLFDDTARTLAFYTQDQFEIAKKFFGTVGVRVDEHSEFGSEATVRVAGGYRMKARELTLRASFGTGFKAPTLTELNPVAFGGNADLRAETSRGFDIGVERYWRERRLMIGGTYFDLRVDDLIIAVFDPGTFSFLNANVDAANARGIELQFEWITAAPVDLRGSYTYTHTEANGSPQGFGLAEGSQLLRRPEHKGGLDLSCHFHEEFGNLTLSASYVGERDDIDPVDFTVVEAEAYWLANLAASLRLRGSLSVFARIDNLLDEQYEEILGFGTAGRSAYAGAKFKF